MNAPTQFAQVGDMIRLVVQFVDQDGVIIDLTGATSLIVKLTYPDLTGSDFTGTLFTDGTDGKIYYDTSRDDLSQIGSYRIQGEATLSGNTFSTRDNPDSLANVLQVYGNVDDN